MNITEIFSDPTTLDIASKVVCGIAGSFVAIRCCKNMLRGIQQRYAKRYVLVNLVEKLLQRVPQDHIVAESVYCPGSERTILNIKTPDDSHYLTIAVNKHPYTIGVKIEGVALADGDIEVSRREALKIEKVIKAFGKKYKELRREQDTAKLLGSLQEITSS